MKKLAPMGPGVFFLLIQTLPTFWAERIWILRIFVFGIFLDPKFPNFQKSGLGRAWARLGRPKHLRGSPCTLLV